MQTRGVQRACTINWWWQVAAMHMLASCCSAADQDSDQMARVAVNAGALATDQVYVEPSFGLQKAVAASQSSAHGTSHQLQHGALNDALPCQAACCNKQR